MRLPELAGVLRSSDVAQTADSIARVQEASGAIPWEPGRHADPWDHVEATMALDVGGLHDAAARAYDWLRLVQRPDGSFAAAYRDGREEQSHADANFCAYVAVGVWHHYLATRDAAFLARLWPTVRRASDFVVGLQDAGGAIRWAMDRRGQVAATALLAGNASMYQSLRCALAISERLGEAQPNWELAVGRLAHAVMAHPERFEEKDRYSMDWYYPVLAGVVRGPRGRARLDERWDEFVVPGLGIRCVADRPWVTGAETCELALALTVLGDRVEAAGLVAAMQHLRADDGSYWTGYVYPDDARWPVERTTWTAAAVLLAVDVLAGGGATARVFDPAALPVGLEDEAAELCPEPACAGLTVR